MEITPSPFAQMMGVEQAAPETVAPAEGFSEALAGAGAPSGGPPGVGAPPGTNQPGEGVEIAEPNAPSRKPDFLPNLSVQDPAALLGDVEDVTGKKDSGASNPGNPDIGAIAAAVAGTLALQLLPQGAQPVVSLKIVQGGQATEPAVAKEVAPVEATVTELPQVPAQPAAPTATPLVAPQLSETQVQNAPAQSLAPEPKVDPTAGAAVFESPAPAWQSTTHRALDDLAFLAKNQDVIQRRTSADPVSKAPQPMSEPDAVPGDFFAIQDEAPSAPTASAATAAPAKAAAPQPAKPTPAVDKAEPSAKVDRKAIEEPTTDAAQGPQDLDPAKPTPKPTVQPAVAEEPQPMGGPRISTVSDSKVEAAQTAQPAKAAKPAKAATDPDAPAVDKVEAADKPERAAAPAPKAGGNDGHSAKDAPKQPETAPVGAKPTPGRSSETAPFPAPQAVEAVERAGSKAVFARSEPLTETQTGEVIKQVVDRAEALAASRPRGGVVVHLEPRDLGSITMVVKSVGNQVDAQIGASNEHVRQALDQSRAQLGQALENRGLNLNSVSIDNQTSSGNYAQTHQQGTQHQQNGGASRPTPMQTADDPTATPNLEAIRKSVRKQSGVDIWT